MKKNESKNISEEFKSRKLGICAYCNLNDRRKVHSAGFDRSKDKHQVNSIEQQLKVTNHIIFDKYQRPITLLVRYNFSRKSK